MSRGNRKAPIFEGDGDRRLFLATLSEIVRRYRVRVHAACLMDNHYHALLDTPRGNLSEAIQQLNSTYSRTANELHHRTGHTFESRFHSVVVQWEGYFRKAARYIVVNPVKAGMCANAAAWPWSTYRATAGLEAPPSWLYIDWLEAVFDVHSREAAHEKYRQYVNMPNATKTTIDFRKQVFGTAAFRRWAKNQSKTTGHDDDRRIVAPIADPPPTLDMIFTTNDFEQRRRDELIHVAHVDHGYTLAKIADYLAMHDSSVRKAFRRYRCRL